VWLLVSPAPLSAALLNAYTAMKPDAPVTSTLDPDLMAGILVAVSTDDEIGG
jgi:hypothetical protein